MKDSISIDRQEYDALVSALRESQAEVARLREALERVPEP